MGLSTAFEAAGDRRRGLLALDDGALGERLAAMAVALREERRAAVEIATFASLPLAEVLASPFGLRAVALGVEAGSTNRHHELRFMIDWGDALRGDASVEDARHGTWERGALQVGKYESFLADEPFATYDPSHSSKWGPHELMHRAAGFFHRADASRFELYLGARLNELAPVMLWYGPEQTLRLDEGAFDREHAGKHKSASVERALWLHAGEAELRERAILAAPILREGIAAFERELLAIDEELASGRRVRVAHPFVDTASDATAYVVGHERRLRDPAVESVLACVPDGSRFTSIRAYRAHVEALFDRLLFGAIEVELERASLRRAGREAWDLVLRAAHAGEDVEPVLGDLRADLARAERGETIADWPSRLAERVSVEAVLEDGSAARPALAQLADGIASFAPCTRALVDLEALARSEAMWDRAPLDERVARFVTDPVLQDMLRLERVIAGAARDDRVERLGEDEGEDDSLLVRSDAFAVHRFAHDVVSMHAAVSAGEDAPTPSRQACAFLVGAYGDDVSILPLSDIEIAMWDRLGRETITIAGVIEALGDDAWIAELIGAGAVALHQRVR